MGFRILLPLFLSIFFLGCNSYKSITVPLKLGEGAEHQLGVTHYFMRPTEIKINSVNSALIKHFEHFEFFLFDYDPTLPNIKPTHEFISKTMFLMGQRDDSIFVIADANTNNRLDDDSIIFIDAKIIDLQSTTKNLEMLPLVHIRNLRVLYNGQWHNFTKKFFLKPRISISKNEKSSLELISNDYMIGDYRYKLKRKYIQLRQSSSGIFNTNPEWAVIKIHNGKNIPNGNYKVTDLNRLNDTVTVGKNSFVIQHITTFLDTIILKPLSPGSFISRKANEKQTTFYENMDQGIGKPYPYLNYLSDSTERFGKNYTNKVLFMNFWFVNCPPCIAEFNALNNLYSQYKNDTSFKFISFTFESPEEIQKIREKYSLLFDIYSLPESEVIKLNLNNFFPTNILIDKNGVVNKLFVGGETNPEKTDLFFKQVVIPNISLLLH